MNINGDKIKCVPGLFVPKLYLCSLCEFMSFPFLKMSWLWNDMRLCGGVMLTKRVLDRLWPRHPMWPFTTSLRFNYLDDDLSSLLMEIGLTISCRCMNSYNLSIIKTFLLNWLNESILWIRLSSEAYKFATLNLSQMTKM